MKITFLGSGSAFTLDNFQSNMLLEFGGKRMLFDCGSDIRWALAEQGLRLTDIDAVYVSHLHADHIAGLEGLAFSTYFSKKPKPKIFGHRSLLAELWNCSLSGGLRSIQMVDAELGTYFEVVSTTNNGNFEYEGVTFHLIQTIHVLADRTFVRSYGLQFMTDKGANVLITADTQHAPYQLRDFIGVSDVVFHDCETSNFMSGVHAHYEDLRGLHPDMKKKMWLYHYNDGPLPDAVADGFQGFVKKGQAFDL